jgi:transposase
VQEATIRSGNVVQFLRQLLRQVPGHFLVIWGGAPIHRAETVKAFLAAGAAHRLHLARLPAYAPELNPDEGIWRYLKYVELRNVCCATLWDLDHEVRLAARHLRRKPRVIRACFTQAGCV